MMDVIFDVAQYEENIASEQEKNQQCLNLFAEDLRAAGLKDKTIAQHVVHGEAVAFTRAFAVADQMNTHHVKSRSAEGMQEAAIQEGRCHSARIKNKRRRPWMNAPERKDNLCGRGGDGNFRIAGGGGHDASFLLQRQEQWHRYYA